jgi:hypothetical protein
MVFSMLGREGWPGVGRHLTKVNRVPNVAAAGYGSHATSACLVRDRPGPG